MLARVLYSSCPVDMLAMKVGRLALTRMSSAMEDAGSHEGGMPKVGDCCQHGSWAAMEATAAVLLLSTS